MVRKKDNLTGNDNRIFDKKHGFFDVISKKELLQRAIWCVVFVGGLGFLAYAFVHAFSPDGSVSLYAASLLISVETGIIVLAIFVLALIFKYIKAIKAVIDEDNEIISNMVGGTMISCFDDMFTIKNATPMFYKVLRYSKGEISKQYHREFSRLLVGEESKLEFAHQKRLLRESGFAEAQYKIHCGDGSDVWVTSRSHLTKNAKLEPIVYTVLFDISREKKMQEKLLLAEARNKIVLENINSGIFEFNMINNTIELSDQLVGRFIVDNRSVIDIFEFESIVHPEDVERLKNAIEILHDGLQENFEITLRLKEKSGLYKHSSMNIILIRDNNNVPVRAVGIVIDVDNNVKKELELRRKADRDSLTGIYNKGATQKLIENAIEVRGDQEHALILCDIDDFKSVNDTFGHGIGDEAIKTVANLLSSVFDNDSIVGRIGGDEFMVMSRSINGDYESLKAKLERLKTDDPHVESNGKKRTLTLSVGVAIFPHDADTYEALYKNADVALYKAKKDGKNRHVFCGSLKNENVN